jgi:hypothetical protein
MPRITERKIEQLCAEVATHPNDDGAKRAAGELRSAIKEHVREAKNSLGAGIQLITSLEHKRTAREPHSLGVLVQRLLTARYIEIPTRRAPTWHGTCTSIDHANDASGTSANH